MDDQAKFQRMLEMLMMISGSYGYSIEQIADKYNISQRTVYRYLTTFQNAGFLLEKKNGYCRIDKASKEYKDLSKLLHFSEEEAHILSKAIHLIDDENNFKHELYEKLYHLFDSDKAVNKIVRKGKSENVIQLKNAIKNKRQVILKNYHSSHSEKIKDRIVEPFDFSSNYVFVWCYDAEDKSNKTFKVARIKDVIVTNKKWKYQSMHKKFETDVFRMSGEKRVKVKLKLSLLAYNLLLEEFPLSEKYLKQNGSNYIFDGWVCNFNGIGRFILGLSGEIEIIFPKQLKDFISEKSQKIFKNIHSD